MNMIKRALVALYMATDGLTTSGQATENMSNLEQTRFLVENAELYSFVDSTNNTTEF